MTTTTQHLSAAMRNGLERACAQERRLVRGGHDYTYDTRAQALNMAGILPATLSALKERGMVRHTGQVATEAGYLILSDAGIEAVTDLEAHRAAIAQAEGEWREERARSEAEHDELARAWDERSHLFDGIRYVGEPSVEGYDADLGIFLRDTFGTAGDPRIAGVGIRRTALEAVADRLREHRQLIGRVVDALEDVEVEPRARIARVLTLIEQADRG